MTSVIGLQAHTQLERTQKAIARSLQRLSSGSRLEAGGGSAADRATISRLQTQVRGYAAAWRNLNEGYGLVTVAEAAISSQIDIVQQLRELSLRASNSSLSSEERVNLNTAFASLVDEFNRISSQTEFNGKKLLDGSFATTTLQAGVAKGDLIELSLRDTRADAMFQLESIETSETVGDRTFSQEYETSTGAPYPTDVLTGDWDADGDNDLVVVEIGAAQARVLLNDGTGTFTGSQTMAFGGFTDWADGSVGDINGDSKLDLIISNGVDANVFVRLGNGNGTFSTGTTLTMSAGYATGTTLADFDGDNDLDLAVANTTNNTATILLNDGSGNFSVASTVTSPSGVYSVVSLDADGDNENDLVVTAYASGKVYVHLGNGNGTFATGITVDVSAGTPRTIQVGDVDEDGTLDLVTGNQSGSVSILIGDGAGSFTFARTYAAGTVVYTVRLTDMDMDGHLDFVTANNGSNDLSVYYGNGNGTFAHTQTITVGAGPYDVAVSDFDGDGIKDLYEINNTARTIRLYSQASTTTTISTPVTYSLLTASNASNLLDFIDGALDRLLAEQSKIAGIHSRLDVAMAHSERMQETASEAIDRTGSVDYALEVAELVRLQILSNAQIAVMAQANLNSQLVLSLLPQRN